MANGLGRGLGSLIPSKINAAAADARAGMRQPLGVRTASGGQAAANDASGKNIIYEVDIDALKTNPQQPRQKFADAGMDDLVKSIREHGIIQPLLASRNKTGQFELIAGERRLRAARAAGLKKVPVVLRDADEKQKLEVALIENIQRENLNSIELAAAYKRLIDEFKLTQEEVSRQVGRSRPSVTNTLRMLNLPQEIQLALIDGKLTEGHAKYLVGLDSEEKQMNLYRKIMHNNLTVRDTDQAARHMGGTKAARIKINYADKDKEFAFREFFGTKVEIKRHGRGGQVILEFFSDEELRGMVEKVKK
jgi:ParB family chromosome partitioning protein